LLYVSEKISIQTYTKPKSESLAWGGRPSLDISVRQEIAALPSAREEKHLAHSAPSEFS